MEAYLIALANVSPCSKNHILSKSNKKGTSWVISAVFYSTANSDLSFKPSPKIDLTM